MKPARVLKFHWFALLFRLSIFLVLANNSSATGKDSLIVLTGGDTIYHEVNTAFKDPGYTFLKKGLHATTSTNINSHVLGIYHISYIITDSVTSSTDTLTRTIIVRDGTPPEINMKGDAAISMCKWFNYVDPGYTVSDNYDVNKDIKIETLGTFKQTDTSGLFTIQYKAIDKSGNIGYSQLRYVQVKQENDPFCDGGVIDSTFFHKSSIYNSLSLKPDLKIFPNPSSGSFSISVVHATKLSGISIYNTGGQLMRTIVSDELQMQNQFIDLTELPTGIYLAKIETSHSMVTQKIVISR